MRVSPYRDGETYDRISAPLERIGLEVLARLSLSGDETVLDAGCGRAATRPPFAARLAGWAGPWNFAAPRQTAERLGEAGFADVSTWLVRRPAPYEELGEWLRSNALGAHTERLPEHLREPFVEAVQEELGPDPEIGYVRLNLDATAA